VLEELTAAGTQLRLFPPQTRNDARAVRYIHDIRLEFRPESGERRRSLHFGNCRKKMGRGNSNRLHELSLAREMYRSNRGCPLSACVQGGGMKSLLAVRVVTAAITAPVSSVSAPQAAPPVKAKTIT
jgi:hypothetical protein